MSSLTIKSICGTSSIPIANEDAKVAALPKVQTKLWGIGEKDVGGAPGCSKRPLAFKLGEDYVLQVNGTASIPPEWQAGFNCTLTGTLKVDGDKGIDVVSATWTVLLPVPQPRQQVDVYNFDQEVTIKSPLGDADLARFMPFGFRGDVVWTLENKLSPLKLVGDVKSQSRLEIYVLPGKAPCGPTTSIQETKIDLQGVWPVNVLRTFTPDFQTLSAPALDADKIKANIWAWWAEHATSRIANNKASYEATEGKSGYNMGWTGGSLDFQAWFDKSSQNVNSFDLTGLLELSFTLLPDRPFGNPRSTRPTWVCMQPFVQDSDMKNGQHAPMIAPFGWPETDLANGVGVSNPFFKGLATGEKKDQESMLSWLEVTTSIDPQPRIVQIARGVKPREKPDAKFNIEDATRTRVDFLAAYNLDPKREIVGQDVIAPAFGGDASCYSSESFSGETSDGSDYQRRVGLYNIRGINEPWPFPTATKPSLLPMSHRFRKSISDLLISRQHDKGGTGLLSQASLLPSAIYPVLDAKVDEKGFSTKVARGVVVNTYQVPASLPGAKDGTGAEVSIPVQVKVKIHVYENYNDALEAMAFELCKFESMLKDVILPPSKLYGAYLVQTKKTLAMVRSNLFIDLTVLDANIYEKSIPTILLDMAGKLDAYLKPRGVLPCQASFPSLKAANIANSEALKVELDKVFPLKLEYKNAFPDAVSVAISLGANDFNEQPIILTSMETQVESTQELQFLPMAKVSKDALNVPICVTVAHSDTFFPVTKTFTVQIQ